MMQVSNNKKKRLFVGIEIPEGIKGQLQKFMQDNCSNELKRIKLIAQKNWHISLLFLGEQCPDSYQKISSALKNIQFKGFSLQLKSSGFFPNMKKARVFWIGVSPILLIQKLHQLIIEQLSSITELKVHREYIPHLTLSRFKKSYSIDFLHSFEKCFSTFLSEEFLVRSIVLFSSQLSSQGANYQRELEIPLV